jgi:hypothetical protein
MGHAAKAEGYTLENLRAMGARYDADKALDRRLCLVVARFMKRHSDKRFRFAERNQTGTEKNR